MLSIAGNQSEKMLLSQCRELQRAQLPLSCRAESHVALDRIANVKSEKSNYPICIGLGPGSLLWPKKTPLVELMTQYIFPLSEKNQLSKKMKV